MGKDITSVLAGWEYQPDEMQVRIVQGDDGREKLQMRLDLGLLQMELDGRPDGERPEGFESLLDLHEHRARVAQEAGHDHGLSAAACAALLREGTQYYHRYLALFHLERFDLVERDTQRNLRLFAFVLSHAINPAHRLDFDRYRPYVLMMRGRARGAMALARGDHASALAAIDEALEGIRRFFRDYDRPESETECPELGFLRRWRREVESTRPIGPVERLEQQLALAVARENYEEAARLRDQLRRLRPERSARGKGAAQLPDDASLDGHEPD